MRIATWNLERPRTRQREKIEALQKRMLSIDADIWILTETNSCVSPGENYEAVATSVISSLGRYTAGENRTTIWSRLPMGGGSITTYDPETAVCAEIQLAGSLFLIYGTIIPYHGAGTRYPYRFLGENQQGRNSWELHYESISRHTTDWLRLRKQFPGHHLVVGGDFNQSREQRSWYGTPKGREALGAALAEAGLACATEGEIQPVDTGDALNPVVDHIALDAGLIPSVTRVRAWPPGVTRDGKRLSDHSGVYVDLAIP